MCPVSGSPSGRRPRTSQSLIVWSWLAVARTRPSGLKAAEVTRPVCPVSGRPAGRRVATSQSWTCSLPVVPASNPPPGLNASAATSSRGSGVTLPAAGSSGSPVSMPDSASNVLIGPPG